MIRRAVDFALSRGVAAGSPIAAYAALRGLDPVLRLAARRRLRRAIESSTRATSNGDPVHALRLAALLHKKGAADADFDDVAGVEAEHATLEPPSPLRARGPWLTLGLVAGAFAAIALVIALRVLLRPFDPTRTDAGRVLGEAIAQFVIGIQSGSNAAGELSAARAEATGQRARRALGDAGVAALERLLNATERLARAAGESRAELDEYYAAAGQLDRALRDRRVPYFVDADVLSRPDGFTPLLLGFYVEREKEVVANDTRVRVVHLWRVDPLRLRPGYLGYTRPRTPAALVLLDQIESELVLYVAPALAPGERVALLDEETALRGEAWAEQVERTAGEAVRRHFAGNPPEVRAGVERVARLFARRRALVEKWRASLSGQGFTLRVPRRLMPEADYSAELELRVPRDNLREWDALHAELFEPTALAAFVELRGRYAATVERHEVQHRLDYARGLVPVPEALCRRLGVENPLGVPEGSLPARTRDELSAYLASMSSPAGSPLLELVLLARFVLDRTQSGGPYSYAALAALEGTGRELGIDVDALLGRGSVTRERFAKLLGTVTARPENEIRAAAARFYQSAFGQPLPAVVERDARDYPAWRH